LHKRGKVATSLQHLKEKVRNKKLQKMTEKERRQEERLRRYQEEKTRALRAQRNQEIGGSSGGAGGNGVEENTPSEDINRICLNPSCEHAEDVNEILTCKSCERKFHAKCLGLPLEYTLVNRFDWFCTDCKLCIICWKSGNEEELLICDCCDRAYHMGNTDDWDITYLHLTFPY
jgi:hypothetical protein